MEIQIHLVCRVGGVVTLFAARLSRFSVDFRTVHLMTWWRNGSTQYRFGLRQNRDERLFARHRFRAYPGRQRALW